MGKVTVRVERQSAGIERVTLSEAEIKLIERLLHFIPVVIMMRDMEVGVELVMSRFLVIGNQVVTDFLIMQLGATVVAGSDQGMPFNQLIVINDTKILVVIGER